MKTPALAAALIAVLIAGHASAKGGHNSPGSSRQTSSSSHHSSRAVTGVARDSHGRIARSQKAKSDFKKQHPCPGTGKPSGACPGYVIDHVKPLKRGGADKPRNMQWQTKRAAKEKDRTE